MLDILKYKQNYLLSESPYQFLWIDNKTLQIKASCNYLFDFSKKIGEPLTAIFPFLEGLQEAILREQVLFLPYIDLSESEDLGYQGVFDFLLFLDENLSHKPIVCIIKDVDRGDKNLFEVQQTARLAMLENDYLTLQNRNIQLENQLLQIRNQELQRSRELKNLFFSKISHELRSPVNGILGLSQIILEQNPSSTDLNNYIESIHTAAKHLRVILDDILDLSKLETGKIEFKKHTFRLNAIFQHLQLNFLKILEQKNLYLNFQISPAVPEILVGDEVRVTQIFYNLISNAIKFTLKGGVSVAVELLSKEDNTCKLRFVVKDTGEGISPKKLEKIFEPYEQLNNTFQELGGTGLGLSVVKQLVEIQGGTISVSSKLNEGTEFVVELTLDFKETEQEFGASQKYIFAGLSVLLVDDSDISRLYTQRLLENFYFEVESCNSSKQALEKLQEKYYDLLITDLRMPELQGENLVELFEKNNPHSKKTAVLFATGSLSSQKLKYPTLLKPYNQGQLYDLLVQVIPKEKTALYGLEYLQKITDNNSDFMRDMINSFLLSCPEDMVKIVQSISQKNANELYKAVHKLKPVATLMGSQVLARILEKMEILSQKKVVNWEIIKKYGENAQEIAKIVLTFFENEMANIAYYAYREKEKD